MIIIFLSLQTNQLISTLQLKRKNLVSCLSLSLRVTTNNYTNKRGKKMKKEQLKIMYSGKTGGTSLGYTVLIRIHHSCRYTHSLSNTRTPRCVRRTGRGHTFFRASTATVALVTARPDDPDSLVPPLLDDQPLRYQDKLASGIRFVRALIGASNNEPQTFFFLFCFLRPRVFPSSSVRARTHAARRRRRFGVCAAASGREYICGGGVTPSILPPAS